MQNWEVGRVFLSVETKETVTRSHIGSGVSVLNKTFIFNSNSASLLISIGTHSKQVCKVRKSNMTYHVQRVSEYILAMYMVMLSSPDHFLEAYDIL